MKTEIIWRAGPDRVAHASLPRNSRTMCGLRVLPEMFAWPKFRHCMICVAATEPATA